MFRLSKRQTNYIRNNEFTSQFGSFLTCLFVKPNIGQSYAPGTGFSADEKQSIFGVGLSGIKETDIEKVETIIHDTLKETVKTGFEKERIEAILHQIELSNKHVSTGI